MRVRVKPTITAALAAVTLSLALPAAAAEGIVNGGFDTGAAPWTADGGLVFSVSDNRALVGFDSNFGASFGTLSQSFTTTADGTFDYAFDAGRGEGACGCDDVGLTFEAFLDGILLSNVMPTFAGSNPIATPLLSHYAGSTALAAGDHTLTFAFSRSSTLFGRGPYFLLDGVQGELTPDVVDPGPGVPEPATWAILISGFGMVGAALRRRRTAVA